MKELSIEEKAKRYDEALWKAGELYQPSDSALLEEIFPELIKYNDEKVRGAIIHFISHTPTVPIGRINKETMLAWLEKQKPSERNSDWSDEDERIRKSLSDFFVKFKPNDMWDADFSFGDIVAWLEKQGEPTDINPSEFDLHLNKLLKQFETLPKEELASSLSFYLNVVQNDGTYREEKQGEQKPQRMISAEAKEAMYGKPTAWSEEDEKMRKKALLVISDDCGVSDYEEISDWLKSLKSRVQPKQEWSEEDALRFEEVICMIEANGRWVRSDDAVKSVLDWLKSLEQRYAWKPSEKQIKAIRLARSFVTDDFDEHPALSEILIELEKQLKKLRGE